MLFLSCRREDAPPFWRLSGCRPQATRQELKQLDELIEAHYYYQSGMPAYQQQADTLRDSGLFNSSENPVDSFSPTLSIRIICSSIQRRVTAHFGDRLVDHSICQSLLLASDWLGFKCRRYFSGTLVLQHSTACNGAIISSLPASTVSCLAPVTPLLHLARNPAEKEYRSYY